ncbi:MAG TPA: hypothetical protein PKA63_05640 [Oligoflexia bacterium]|nr:hypothetical protein [Oligoflexia bacterium]HMP48132.1 hypothetical protein [Oligoflexia bacterium]
MGRTKINSKLAQCVKAADEFEAFIASADYEAATRALKEMPFFEIPTSSEFLPVLRTHHQDFLARCVELTELMNARASNICELESLFTERGDLLQLVFKARFSFETLLEKRGGEGKTIPLWTRAEFEKKEEEIREALHLNKNKLEREIDFFVSNLRSTPRGEALIH